MFSESKHQMMSKCRLYFWPLVENGVFVFKAESGKSFVLMNEQVDRKKVRNGLTWMCKNAYSIATYCVIFTRSPLNPDVWMISFRSDHDLQQVIVDLRGMEALVSECVPLRIN